MVLAMHGGMKVYAGAPAAARHYVEVGRGRADDYYLAEGTGIARRFTVTDGRVVELPPLSGNAYESWVAGRDPDSGKPRGRLREDARAVRFVEVVVNGPKSWSLAAALHPDVAVAYEGAQDRAAAQILGWVSQHATTRVGPRGGQVPVPLSVLEAATVRHYTSRAGDPHWHLHLQVNSRVYAADKWRGLFTVDIRDSLCAINGIGHAAMATDPELNAALAAHGYSKDPTGEIRQLAEYVGPFSARHQQIARNVDRYEREWTAAHPGEHAGPALRRSWDARAWADHRPDKITPQPGEGISGRWQTLLADLGYRSPDRPVDMAATAVGALNRDALAERALVRLAAGRSAWNPADVRGEVERLVAEAGVVTQPAVRAELAEDLTARALGRCVRLLDREQVPKHIRAWTSPAVLEVEADLAGRLAARAAHDTDPAQNDPLTPRVDGVTPLFDEEVTPVGVGVTPLAGGVTPRGTPGVTPLRSGVTPPSHAAAGRLDAGQAAAAVVLAGDRRFVLVEGAAGAGKTTTLAATRDLLAAQGRRLVVVTPTLKAAQAAGREVGAAAGSAAGLAYQYGWRWDDDGAWTRLLPGQVDPAAGRVFTGPSDAARLRAGDLLVVDEAGMLDQDTARALLTVADEAGVRVALLGDRHQLPAVGRGGVLDLAAQPVDPTGHLTLDEIHRFVRPDQTGDLIPDREYGELTLAMRAGADPGGVFDALVARGQIEVHYGEEERRWALAEVIGDAHTAGQRLAVVVDTREQAYELNAAIRGYLSAVGWYYDTPTTPARGGQPVGPGDLIVTRRNDRTLGVSNRDTWTITAVHPDGSLTVTPGVTPAAAGTGGVPRGVTPGVTPGPGPARVLPAGYVREHVELAYASTAHGVQGDTVTAAHLVVGEHTGAASAYVGMTRGRHANTAHLIAADLADAREQWIAAFGRDNADLGPGQAGKAAARAAADFAPAPVPVPAGPEQIVSALQPLPAAWSEQVAAYQYLSDLRGALGSTQAQAARWAQCAPTLEPLQKRLAIARAAEEHATPAAAGCADMLADAAERIARDLRTAWNAQIRDAEQDARVIAAGPGRLALHRTRVRDAAARLDVWAARWGPAFGEGYPTIEDIRRHPAGYSSGAPAVGQALYARARHLAAAEHPDATSRLRRAQHASAAHLQAVGAYSDAMRALSEQSFVADYYQGADRYLPDLHAHVDAAQTRAEQADQHVQQLSRHPAITSQPDPPAVLAAARTRWAADRDARQRAARDTTRNLTYSRHHSQAHDLTPGQARGPSIGR
jgi:hypothetical protein